jgi:DNA-directed RNA polymerase subunit N (RpoN/RPB10)
MIIPVRCVTCGKVIGSKYYHYKEEVAARKKKAGLPNEDTVINMNASHIEKTIEGQILDELGLVRLCCRKVFLGHIEFK